MSIKQTLLAAAFGIALSGSVSAYPLDGSEAEGLLVRRGFTDISTLRYDAGMWFARATDASGRRVDVRIDPTDLKVTTVSTVMVTSPPPSRVVTRVIEKPVIVEKIVERPVVVEQVVERPVVVEQVVERPVVVEQPVTRTIVREHVYVPAAGKISKEDVRLALSDAGYYNIHDIDWLSSQGVWKAEARDMTGDDLEIHVDPIDARVVHIEND